MILFIHDRVIGGITNWKLDDELVIHQSTNLKDKNNKEIYEGDILKIPDNDTICLPAQNCEVIFDFQSFGIKCLDDDGMEIFCCLSAFEHGVLEVIGNKFENPGLFK